MEPCGTPYFILLSIIRVKTIDWYKLRSITQIGSEPVIWDAYSDGSSEMSDLVFQVEYHDLQCQMLFKGLSVCSSSSAFSMISGKFKMTCFVEKSFRKPNWIEDLSFLKKFNKPTVH